MTFVIQKDVRIRRISLECQKNSLFFQVSYHLVLKFNVIPVIKVFEVSCKEWMCHECPRKNECAGSTDLTAFFGRWLQRFAVIMCAVFFTAEEQIEQYQPVLRLVSYFNSPIGCFCLSEAGYCAPFKEAAAFTC